MTIRPFVESLSAARSHTRELRAFVDGALAPPRPKLAETVEATRDATTGAAAWEALLRRALVPDAWRAPSLCFAPFVACASCRGTGFGDHGGPCLRCFRARVVLGAPTDAPPSREFAVALASVGAQTLATLDALAWQAAAALAPWRAPGRGAIPTPRRLCWCVEPKRAWRHRDRATVELSRAASEACAAAMPDLQSTLRAFEREVIPDAVPDDSPRVSALVTAIDAMLWREASRRELTVPALRGYPEGHEFPVGQRFSSLPDPFVDRCEAWATGCTLDAIERDGTVVVFVPA